MGKKRVTSASAILDIHRNTATRVEGCRYKSPVTIRTVDSETSREKTCSRSILRHALVDEKCPVQRKPERAIRLAKLPSVDRGRPSKCIGKVHFTMLAITRSSNDEFQASHEDMDSNRGSRREYSTSFGHSDEAKLAKFSKTTVTGSKPSEGLTSMK